MSLTCVCLLIDSAKRTLKPTVKPKGVPNSSAIRAAIERAAIRRGCVWPIRPSMPRPISRQIFGNCVDLPEPVSPLRITTWFSSIVRAISCRRAETGNSSSNRTAGRLFRRYSRKATDSSNSRKNFCSRFSNGRFASTSA